MSNQVDKVAKVAEAWLKAVHGIEDSNRALLWSAAEEQAKWFLAMFEAAHVCCNLAPPSPVEKPPAEDAEVTADPADVGDTEEPATGRKRK